MSKNIKLPKFKNKQLAQKRPGTNVSASPKKKAKHRTLTETCVMKILQHSEPVCVLIKKQLVHAITVYGQLYEKTSDNCSGTSLLDVEDPASSEMVVYFALGSPTHQSQLTKSLVNSANKFINIDPSWALQSAGTSPIPGDKQPMWFFIAERPDLSFPDDFQSQLYSNGGHDDILNSKGARSGVDVRVTKGQNYDGKIFNDVEAVLQGFWPGDEEMRRPFKLDLFLIQTQTYAELAVWGVPLNLRLLLGSVCVLSGVFVKDSRNQMYRPSLNASEHFTLWPGPDMLTDCSIKLLQGPELPLSSIYTQVTYVRSIKEMYNEWVRSQTMDLASVLSEDDEDETPLADDRTDGKDDRDENLASSFGTTSAKLYLMVGGLKLDDIDSCQLNTYCCAPGCMSPVEECKQHASSIKKGSSGIPRVSLKMICIDKYGSTIKVSAVKSSDLIVGPVHIVEERSDEDWDSWFADYTQKNLKLKVRMTKGFNGGFEYTLFEVHGDLLPEYQNPDRCPP